MTAAWKEWMALTRAPRETSHEAVFLAGLRMGKAEGREQAAKACTRIAESAEHVGTRDDPGELTDRGCVEEEIAYFCAAAIRALRDEEPT